MKAQNRTPISIIIIIIMVKLMVVVIAAPTESTENIYTVPLQTNRHFRKNATHAVFKVRSKYTFFLDPLKTADSPLSKGSVEMTDENDVEYYGTVKVGTPGQALKLNFDTGSSDLWFASSFCLFCGSHTKYNPLASSTYSAAMTPWSVQYGDGSTAGGVTAKDSVDIGGILIRQQTIQLATHESFSFRQGVTDGLLGLGFSSLASVRGTLTPADNMIRHNLIKDPIFSVYLGKQKLGGGGVFMFGNSNPAHFSGSLTPVAVDSSKGFWSVKVASLSTAGDKTVPSKTDNALYGSFEAIVDTGTTLLILQKKTSPTNSGFDSLVFSLGGSLFQIPGDDLVYVREGAHCIAGFATGDFPFSILGDVFIRNNYVVFDMKVPQIQLAPVRH
ncbi:hypothetical protein [Absidia glauca]|uniref:rhizopuspepsin n=1 Tax=Absidia glauca TaxID=4829 RepID=A0A168S0J8_ABSGL|nr:hypothetical protein [Absidia glauca]